MFLVWHSHSQENVIRLALAKHFEVQYDSQNHDKAFGMKVGNIEPYDPTEVADWHAKIATSGTGPEGVKVREQYGNYSTVINGNQVRWFAHGKLVNEGYIEHWASQNLKNWDKSIERKGGNPDASVDWRSQHFALTNMSSLTALLAQVVYQFLAIGTVDPDLATAFISIRVSLRLGSGADEIEIMNSEENIEQAERKKRSELDNLSDMFQCIESMKGMGKSGMDPENGVHVFKYMCALVNPNAKQLPAFLQNLLDKKSLAPTLANRVMVMSSSDIGVQWLKVNKVTSPHPVLKTYPDLVLRLRFTKGFSSVAFDKLVNEFASEAGRHGLASLESPLTRTLLMDANLLKSEAFIDKRQQEAVPSYRDGRAGDMLHSRMADDFIDRYFLPVRKVWGSSSSSDVLPGSSTISPIRFKPRDTFKTADAWVAYSRLTPFIERILQMKYGNAAETWPEAAAKYLREHQMGSYDLDCLKTSSALPAQFDSRPSEMMKLIEQNFQPLKGMLNKIAAAEALKQAPQDTQKDQTEPGKDEETNEGAGEDQKEVLGDVTQELAKDMSAADKIALVQKLNKEQKQQHHSDTQGAFLKAASNLWRDKVFVFENVDQAKTWLESSQAGLRVRSVVIDVSMPDTLQTSSTSRDISKKPDEVHQKGWAASCKKLPATPIVGHLIIRPCQHDIHLFEKEVDNTHQHGRTITVQIALPKSFQAKLDSAQKRSFGPHNDTLERSGVDFVMRSIGRRSESAKAVDDENEEEKSDDEGAEVGQAEPTIALLLRIP